MIRRTILGTVAAAAAACLAAPTSAVAHAQAPVPALRGAGYVARPAHLHNSTVTLRVPTLKCTTRSATRSIQLGMFGVLRIDGQDRHWHVVVVASCRNGDARYRGSFGEGDPTQAGGLGVHAGDLVRLSMSDDATSYEIDDRTTGTGVGGGGTFSGDVSAARRVLIGGRTTGHVPAGTVIGLRRAKVNHGRLGHAYHRRLVQHRNGAVVLRPSVLHGHGEQFTLTTK